MRILYLSLFFGGIAPLLAGCAHDRHEREVLRASGPPDGYADQQVPAASTHAWSENTSAVSFAAHPGAAREQDANGGSHLADEFAMASRPGDSEPVRRASHTVDAAWTASEAESSPAAALPDEEIRPLLTLTQLIQRALESSPDLQSASEQVRIADAALSRAYAEFSPVLSVAENYGVSDNPVNAFTFVLNQAELTFDRDFNDPPVTDNFHTQFQLQHSVYAGGRRAAETAAAEHGREASASALAGVKNQLVFRVAEAYYRLLQASELVDVRIQAVEQIEEHLKIVRLRRRAGTAVESDVLSIAVERAEAEEALITARNRLELAWSVLENVVGDRVDRRPLPEEVPEAAWAGGIDDLQAAVSEALAMRPEVGRIANQQQEAEHRVDAAQSGNRPAVDLVANYNVHTGDFNSGDGSFFVGLAAQLNLFDGGRTRSEVERAWAQVREIDARRRRLSLDIELDVRRAHLQLADAEERLQVTRQAVSQAEESLRETEVLYEGQAATLTKLIDAQVALSQARVRRANAEADVQIAQAALQRAIGRLVEFFGP